MSVGLHDDPEGGKSPGGEWGQDLDIRNYLLEATQRVALDEKPGYAKLPGLRVQPNGGRRER